MLPWHDKDIVRLYGAFPASLKNDVERVIAILPLNKGIGLSEWDNTVLLNGESLQIPYRIYFDEPDAIKEKALSPTQKLILNCLYTRHYDGFLRQRRLENLTGCPESFIVPFIIKLLSEYVLQILDVLDHQLQTSNLNPYSTFVRENPLYWRYTKSRMVSYWNEYYRRKFPKLRSYIGKAIVDKIENAIREQSI